MKTDIDGDGARDDLAVLVDTDSIAGADLHIELINVASLAETCFLLH